MKQIQLDKTETRALQVLCGELAVATAIRVWQQAELPRVPRSEVMAALRRMETLGLVRTDHKGRFLATAAGVRHDAEAEAAAEAAAPAAEQTATTGLPVLPQTQQPCMPRRMTMGTGDLRPPVLRPGAMDALALPSLVGSYRRWRAA